MHSENDHDKNVAVKFAVCAKHGEYVAFSTPQGQTRCPACEGMAKRKIHLTDSFTEDRGVRDMETEQKMGQHGVPARFVGCTFGNFWPATDDEIEVLRAMEAYAASFETTFRDGSNLVLTGKTGTGKTHLGVALLANLHKRGYRVRYLDARRRFGLQMKPADLLVLDNVGHMHHGSTVAAIRELLLDRYDNVLPTVVITRMGRESLGATLGQQVLDRLRQGGSMLLEFQWESYRASIGAR